VDGGQTFENVPTPHGDNHDLWIDPLDSNRLIEGNDGGAIVSFDGGRSWSTLLNQPTAQFYHVVADDKVPYNVYGSQQDNWAMRVPSIDFEGAISWKDYVEPGGGESGYIAISPKAPHRVMGGGIGTGAGHGRLISWNPETGQKRNITVWPEVHGMGAGAESLKYRFQWTFPVAFSSHDPNVLYVTSNHVHRSNDEGQSWEVISPDLTHNDPSKLGPSGGPITTDNSGAEIYCTIFAFAESPHEAGVLWAGSDDGLVHVSRDGGQSWQDVTPRDLPGWALISVIEVSPHDRATAYVTATRYKHDDYAPYVYRTNDYGQTWTRITGGLPPTEYVRSVRADPNRKGLLYAGTEVGLWVSFDDGANWQRFQSNLPVTPIHDVAIKGTDLIAATHGRAFWILDDLTPLYQMHDQVGGQSAHLFKPRPTTRFRVYGRAFGSSKGYINYKMTGPVTVAYRVTETAMGTQDEEYLDAGKNPPDGVIIHYWLKDKPEGEVTLTILDANGETLRSFSSTSEEAPRVPVAAGANRFVWNMREAGPTKLDEPARNDRMAQMMAEGVAPRVLPGTYQVRLEVGGETFTEQFTIERDPRLSTSVQDLEEQYRVKRDLRDRISEVHRAINQIRSVRKQVESWESRASDAGKGNAIAAAAGTLKEQLGAIEGQLIQVNSGKAQPGTAALNEKLSTLSGMIDESDDRPTAGAREVYDMLAEQVQDVTARLRDVLERDLAAFNGAIESSGVPAVVA
ncbi:MAG TPA: glycosyl hydrolase, partial [Thermomicrobiaceae bacterium]|nr:glycosyl hydrolase [Thermomicrobiaceae bacterium]